MEHGQHGKPALAPRTGAPPVAFNLAHTDSAALLAVAIGREVGVDIERVRPGLDVDALSGSVLSAREQRALRGRYGDARVAGFLTYWTRKEAYLKARGEGLRHDLPSLGVLRTEGCHGGVHVAPDDPEWPDAAARWCVRDILVGGAHVAAVAARGHDWDVKRFPWDPSEAAFGVRA